VLHSNLSLPFLQSSYCVMDPKPCMLLLPNCQMTHFTKVYCISATVRKINALMGTPKQKGHDVIAKVHVISAMIEFSKEAWKFLVLLRWYDFLCREVALTALSVSYVPALIQFGRVCSNSRPSRWFWGLVVGLGYVALPSLAYLFRHLSHLPWR